MEPGESELGDKFARNERAINNALKFTSNRIVETAKGEINPQYAAQLGTDYIFYTHQSLSLQLRKMDSSGSINRDTEDVDRIFYRLPATKATETGKILDSLDSEPDLAGIRNFLEGEARIMEVFGNMNSREGRGRTNEEIEKGKKTLAIAEAYKKVAVAIPDSGVEVEKPKIFAWMDPRFNGESDTVMD